MRRIHNVMTLCAVLILALSCKQTPEPQDQKVEAAPQQSELAQIMRIMEAHGDAARKAIRHGEELPAQPEELAKLLSARPTPGMDIHAASYPAFVDDYLRKAAALHASDSEEQMEAYNAMIQSCDNCHRVNCPGPLMKIEKMYIISTLEH